MRTFITGSCRSAPDNPEVAVSEQRQPEVIIADRAVISPSLVTFFSPGCSIDTPQCSGLWLLYLEVRALYRLVIG